MIDLQRNVYNACMLISCMDGGEQKALDGFVVRWDGGIRTARTDVLSMSGGWDEDALLCLGEWHEHVIRDLDGKGWPPLP